MWPARIASKKPTLPKTMKNPSLISLAAIVLFAASGCDKQSPDAAKKIAELERKNDASAERQRELEQQLEDRKLAAERDAIERERMRIEEDRAELERQKGEAAAAEDDAIRKREEALANREGKLEQFQSALGEKEDELGGREQQLGDRDREQAGREALPFQQTEQREPVADYGMFYDSLSSYGSWFETPDYGYVWQPAVVRNSNWRPYSRGRWVCSDRGWTWVSEEPFGWATYHYGRWALLRGRGWIWVPGAEWAPCWVSWRESGSHIGWAPLPPETLAYRGHAWDSTVDAQFGIGARWFNFVEIRHFGSPVYNHCLPVSRNGLVIGQTTNITYIHIENRQVICGGPRYKELSGRIGRPLPFYRLEVDQHPRQSSDPLGMRPQFKGDRLMVPAPNIDAAWNDGLKPGRIKGRMESVTVERDAGLSDEIAGRFRRSREELREQAEQTIAQLGGRETFDQRRNERLQENRRQAEKQPRGSESRDVAVNPDRPQRGNSSGPGNREPGRAGRPANLDLKQDQVPDTVVRQPNEDRGRPGVQAERTNSQGNNGPRVALPEETQQRSKQAQEQPIQRQADGPRVAPRDGSKQEGALPGQPRPAEQTGDAQKDALNRAQEDQAGKVRQQEKQVEVEQTRAARQEAMKHGQEDLPRQEQMKQDGAEQTRAVQQEAMKRRQEEQARQQQERAQRQQQQEQQREMQRQQEQAQQRQQEQARQQQEQAQQRQQEQARQQQEQAQQRQQEQARQQQEQAQQRQQQEQARQQQEQARQQEQGRQRQEKDQKDEDEKSRRNR